ncbi:ubiquitin carboxyl-terminal hydrolase isozyme L3-like protein [Phascolomyces articulosus]|uniref:Ubiquitin carboxyl-terminal hydrolase n=1 Tax=Phascolomyces articulosus TaxID=60185 RepID=A0AAD5KAP1_9FUNG|nr:ubiquitin carboxyl-terminal hydrolase isozyme L3-like protein [Phascolomyces articulosus]
MTQDNSAQSTMSKQKPKLKWVMLEGNPEVWNKMIHENGVDEKWCFYDIYGFDQESLSTLPRPISAIIFLYPYNDLSRQFIKEEKEKFIQEGQQDNSVSDKVMFFEQTIGNACGMMALIHALANNKEVLGPGLFHDIVTKAEKMTVDERIELLESNEQLAIVHKGAALSGQTEPPTADTKDSHCYACFTNIDGHIYELDGSKGFPINHGSSNDFVESAVRVLGEFIQRDPTCTGFSAMALAKSSEQ